MKNNISNVAESGASYKNTKFNGEYLDLLATHFLICSEIIEGNGEDCGFESFNSEAGVIGVFDGCGGLGAIVCPYANNKTEAYLAARAVGNAVRLWFSEYCEHGYDCNVDQLKKIIISNLEICRQNTQVTISKLQGSLVRQFPSTIAMIVSHIEDGTLITNHIWAGDSRTFILDSEGLGQISIDDISGEDAMSNLQKDSALTNVVSVDGNFVLHTYEFIPKYPCVLFCATDGCFGYVSSPMAFEKMILECLMKSNNVEEWESLLAETIASFAGDDQTMVVSAYGFDNYTEFKDSYKIRYEEIKSIVDTFDSCDINKKKQLWENYKSGYYRFLCRR